MLEQFRDGASILPFGLMDVDSHIWIVCTLSDCTWRERFNFSSEEYARGNGQILSHALYHMTNDHGK